MANRPASRPRRHLYLIFDDWCGGYSIRKVDLRAIDDGTFDYNAKPLPRALLRLEAPRGLPMFFTAAFKTKVFALHPMVIDGTPTRCASRHLVYVLDLPKRGLIHGPRPKERPVPPKVFVPVGDRLLFALGDSTWQVLYPPPLEDGHYDRLWSWKKLGRPPFSPSDVVCYGAVPDGWSVFFCLVTPNSEEATYVFTFGLTTVVESDDEGEEALVSKLYGNWSLHSRVALPLIGQAHYVRKLDGWVGLSRSPASLGHLCFCSSELPVRPCSTTFRISEENLFMPNGKAKHVGATLVHLGGKSNSFCLVQCIAIKGNETVDDPVKSVDTPMNDMTMDDPNDVQMYELEEEDMEEEEEEEEEELKEQEVYRRRHHLLRLTTFSVMFGENGKLTTGKSRRKWCYSLPQGITKVSRKQPVAFWM